MAKLDPDVDAMNIGQPVSHGLWWNVYIGLVSLGLVSVVVAYALTARPQQSQAKLEPVALVMRPDDFESRFGEPSLLAKRVRTIAIVRPREVEPRFDIEAVLQAAPIPPQPVAAAPPRRVAGDVCKRHGMKKVMTGKYRWRCRR